MFGIEAMRLPDIDAGSDLGGHVPVAPFVPRPCLLVQRKSGAYRNTTRIVIGSALVTGVHHATDAEVSACSELGAMSGSSYRICITSFVHCDCGPRARFELQAVAFYMGAGSALRLNHVLRMVWWLMTWPEFPILAEPPTENRYCVACVLPDVHLSAVLSVPGGFCSQPRAPSYMLGYLGVCCLRTKRPLTNTMFIFRKGIMTLWRVVLAVRSIRWKLWLRQFTLLLNCELRVLS